MALCRMDAAARDVNNSFEHCFGPQQGRVLVCSAACQTLSSARGLVCLLRSCYLPMPSFGRARCAARCARSADRPYQLRTKLASPCQSSPWSRPVAKSLEARNNRGAAMTNSSWAQMPARNTRLGIWNSGSRDGVVCAEEVDGAVAQVTVT